MKTAIAFLTIICLNGYSSIASKPVSGQFGFIENKGQIIDQNNNLNPSVLYLYNGNGLHVQLKQTGFSYEVWKVSTNNKQLAISSKMELNNQLLEVDTIFIHRIDISFVNSNPNAIITASQPAPDYINYYTTGTSEQGVINVHHYKKIAYQNIYNNIDVEFVLNDEKNCGNFKYNFIVKPGGNPNDIQLKFDGATSTTLTSDGHITIETAYGNIDESIPSTYQLDNQNNHNLITSNFKFLSTNNHQLSTTYGIAVGTYDATKTLIIDPFPSTYLGGTTNDAGSAIATDNAHNIIAYGITTSSASIATSGAYQTSILGILNCFIAKFNSTGTIQWSTYFGGASTISRTGHTLATDALNNIFVVGGYTTSSTIIATTGAYQTAYAGGGDTFIEKFDSLGTRQWGTYFGGSGIEQGYGIAIDRSGNLLITGYTASSSSIATSGAYKTSYAGGSGDAFVAKFNSSGTALLWATYYGGTGAEQGRGIATDLNGNVYMAGWTTSTAGISSSGSWQSTYGGGNEDAFIVKFDSSGSRLWGTYYGQDQTDYGLAIGLDVIGNVFVTGYTNSASGFTSSGSFHPSYSGGSSYGDAFILKFLPTGTRIWATYYGGSDDDIGECLTFDQSGNIYLTGETASTDSISTAGAYQTTYGGGLYDAFIVKFDSVGARLWATYFGDSLTDIGYSIVVEWNGEILITGGTNSTSRIANSAGYQTVFGGGPADAFIASFNTGGSLPVQLMSFDVKLIGNREKGKGDSKVLCTWQTASELNNDYFEVERSTVDSPQTTVGGDWKVIGKVKGNGTTNVVNNYQFIDEGLSAVHSQLSTVYYRLRQIDFDGNSTLSEIRVINLNQTNTNWNIYPNPATNELHIETTGNEKFGIQLFDITGKQVMDNILFIKSVNFFTELLSEGMYFVRITDANGVVVKTQKVAVVR